jgi:hypothetical protein
LKACNSLVLFPTKVSNGYSIFARSVIDPEALIELFRSLDYEGFLVDIGAPSFSGNFGIT